MIHCCKLLSKLDFAQGLNKRDFTLKPTLAGADLLKINGCTREGPWAGFFVVCNASAHQGTVILATHDLDSVSKSCFIILQIIFIQFFLKNKPFSCDFAS